MLNNKNCLIVNPSELEGFILSEYCIKCGVAMLEGPSIQLGAEETYLPTCYCCYISELEKGAKKPEMAIST